jgi:hypothetical protein
MNFRDMIRGMMYGFAHIGIPALVILLVCWGMLYLTKLTLHSHL